MRGIGIEVRTIIQGGEIDQFATCCLAALPSAADVVVLSAPGAAGKIHMRSESIGGAFGAIVAAVVLAAAFYYVPVGPFAKRAAKIDVPPQPVQTVPVAPAPRGPVVREVPN
jgi:hypothetical protein